MNTRRTLGWLAAAWLVPTLASAQREASGGVGGNEAAPEAAQAEPGADTRSAADGSAARDTEARHLFEAGRNAYDDGRYQDALDYFQRGYELSQRPQLLYNVGQAADRLRHDETALEAFKLYLGKLPDAENRPQVEERIRVLEEVVAQKRAPTAAPAAVAPSPAPAASALATDVPPPRDEGNLLDRWWFWAGAGGVVVAGVVIVAVLAGSGGGGGGGELTRGSSGVTVAVLSL